ncbi:Acg family FMN-binding oxidoreductase [Sediminicurvatus halobius]|nr:hypothetical protein [Spiribacter halobius]UEX77841.1 hypothetical protein LMH63_18240 [Spiribacter halobius]
MELIRHAVMAPSSHNTQPWRFELGDGAIRLRPDFHRRLPVVDPDDHALFISLGCALENLVIAAGSEGIQPSLAYFPEDEEANTIRVRLARPDADSQQTPGGTAAALFRAIPKRQSTRRAFDSRPLPAAVVRAIAELAAEPLVSPRLVTDRDLIGRVAEQVESACRTQLADPAFVEELICWIRFGRREAEARGDGLAARVMGLPSMPRWLGKRLMRLALTPAREAARAAAQVRSSSALMIFSVETDTPEAWVRAGQSFERAALLATSEGVRHAHVNMPCEVPEASERLRVAFGLSGRPVLLIRLGYAEPMPFSYRRPLPDVVRYAADQAQAQAASGHRGPAA